MKKPDEPGSTAVAETLRDLDRMLRTGLRQLRRLLVFMIGTTVVLVGVIMVITPGPAIVVIPVGLGILAIEFAWARILLKRFRDRASKVGTELREMMASTNGRGKSTAKAGERADSVPPD